MKEGLIIGVSIVIPFVVASTISFIIGSFAIVEKLDEINETFKKIAKKTGRK